MYEILLIWEVNLIQQTVLSVAASVFKVRTPEFGSIILSLFINKMCNDIYTNLKIAPCPNFSKYAQYNPISAICMYAQPWFWLVCAFFYEFTHRILHQAGKIYSQKECKTEATKMQREKKWCVSIWACRIRGILWFSTHT